MTYFFTDELAEMVSGFVLPESGPCHDEIEGGIPRQEGISE